MVYVWRTMENPSGWWLGHPSEKYELVNRDDDRNPIFPGKSKNHGNPTTNQSFDMKVSWDDYSQYFRENAKFMATSHHQPDRD